MILNQRIRWNYEKRGRWKIKWKKQYLQLEAGNFLIKCIFMQIFLNKLVGKSFLHKYR
jgi:hypothetical protein